MILIYNNDRAVRTVFPRQRLHCAGDPEMTGVTTNDFAPPMIVAWNWGNG